MSRNTSLAFNSAIAAQDTDVAFIVLLEITHSTLTNPIRVTSDNVATVSNGETYLPYPFILTMPTDNSDAPPLATLTLDNIDRILVATIREITTPPAVSILCVLSSDPDTVEIEFADFEMKNISYDVSTIHAELTVEGFLTEPFPGDRFLPFSFPGVF